MTTAGLMALLPMILIAATAVVAMLLIAFYRNHLLTALLTLLGLALAFISIAISTPITPRLVTTLLVADNFAGFYMALILVSSFIVAALSYSYLKKYTGNHEEFYVLLLLANLGAMVLVASNHFVSFFLGLEILSVSLYGLIAYLRNEVQGIEAGLKYLTLAAVSAAFLLFGMALIYAELGTMTFDQLARMQISPGGPGGILALTGLGLMIVGIGFKLAIVPFHMWVPDVYEGAPAMVTAFIATVSKGAVFALLLRFFARFDLHAYPSLFLIFSLIAIASMLAGNLLALLQDNIKRILAYSSIAHLGYLLVAFLASKSQGVMAATFYLVAYFITTLGAFGVISLLSGPGGEADKMEQYHGLFWRRPWLASVFTAMLFSLAGIPLTAGFTGKFYILSAGVGSAAWFLALVLVIGSGIGLYYYLRIIVAMYRPLEPEEVTVERLPYLPFTGNVVLAVLFFALIWLGVYPSPLLDIIQTMIGRLI